MSSLSFRLNQTVLDKRENNQQLVDIIEQKKRERERKNRLFEKKRSTRFCSKDRKREEENQENVTCERELEQV